MRAAMRLMRSMRSMRLMSPNQGVVMMMRAGVHRLGQRGGGMRSPGIDRTRSMG